MATEPPRKRCLYEVLGVSREASPEEIRSAYRRLALQLHPDKQLAAGTAASPEAATTAFQELLHAYEVLSDPKERSWYDSHRSQILFSNPNPNPSKPNSAFFDVDLYSYFSNSAFSGFSDSGKGFFKVYGDLFSKIYSQELLFAKELALSSDAVPPAPLIGNLESPYTQVTAFYNYWLGFSTVMDFVWVDEYDASMGPNRRSRRAMEEENKKVRKKARREYNDSVRGLAAFAKKRDKRVVDMQVKKKNEEEMRRKEEKEKRKEEERKRLERARMYEEPEWARIDEEMVDGVLNEFGDDESRKKDKGMEELYCVACSKKFKSDKQWKNHEQSKKHKEKVAELRDIFLEEEEDLEEEDDVDADEKGAHVEFDYEPPSEEEDSNAVEDLCEEFEEDVALKEEVGKDGVVESGAQILGSDDEESVLEAMVSGHKHKNRNSGHAEFHESPSPSKDFNPVDDEDDPVDSDRRRRGQRNRATKKGDHSGADAGTARAESTERSETMMPDDGDSKNQRGKDNDSNGVSVSSEEIATRSKGDRGVGKSQKVKKQQPNRSALVKKEVASESKDSSKGRRQKASSKAASNACGTCGESFDSRNKLFAHLGGTGHAMLKLR